MWSLHGAELAGGAAKRRRERRLRQFLRHDRVTVAMHLAEMTHHAAPRGQTQARSGRWEYETHYTAKFQKTPPPKAAATEHYLLTDDEGWWFGSWVSAACSAASGRTSHSSTCLSYLAVCLRRLLAEPHTSSLVVCLWDLQRLVMCVQSMLQLPNLLVVRFRELRCCNFRFPSMLTRQVPTMPRVSQLKLHRCRLWTKVVGINTRDL